ncbi:protein CDV3 homolog [Topomyia yanbarensis]|uniref:protein CDV3 homolog n=1 Tax=Topomyia yanbarensis TaxID=2498891 RepID=UPI00273CD2F8|nr:protein CDV3 homolog [Topomyia yanbarensis]XP_058840762.1 protein CDV3 homolog [Topomyia yanbarensis]
MADLDDFFAKKDRKKSKTKKFATAEELAKSIEDTSKKTTEAKPRKVTPNVEGSEPKVPEPVEEEWKEFEEERKDYSGLKLAQLNISEEDQNQVNYGGDENVSTPGENEGEKGGAESADRKASGAWKMVDSSDTNEKQQQQQQQPQQPQQYVAPALKSLRMKSKKGAPDLKNEEFFPTLGAEIPDPSRSKKDSTFEEVKHGGRVRPSDMPSAAPLSVGNRFTSLSNDAS